MRKKQFAVVGMGRFGSSVAQSLSEMGFEVLAIDSDEDRIQEIASTVTHAVSADTTDEEALRAIGVRNFDVVVVAIGEDIQASILTTLILKDLGVPYLIVKAQNELHGKVLSKIGADRVVYPERDMGLRVAHHLISPSVLDFIELTPEHGIIEIEAPDAMIGRTLKQLDLRARHQCNVLGIKNNGKMDITPSPDHVIGREDVLVIVGSNKDILRLEVAYAVEREVKSR
ncbi:trk system potassium uptake protein TrkA [Paenibacillaceae bacterium GAS479]|nr:trk system potassium uptake protein TrkA [Paenibacillaceae bacterium GAS479]